jgi:hypothetical protein
MGLFFSLTGLVIWVTHQSGIPPALLGAVLLFSVALLHRSFPWRTNRSLYTLAWALELCLSHGIAYAQDQYPGLNYGFLIAHLTLAVVSEAGGRWYGSHRDRPLVAINNSIKILPLLWALLAGVSHLRIFTAWSGAVTLGIAWVLIQVGRPIYTRTGVLFRGWKPWTVVGLALVTLSLGEFLAFAFYPKASLLILAWSALGSVLALIYRYGSTEKLSEFLQLSLLQLRQIAHGHWGLGAGLMVWGVLGDSTRDLTGGYLPWVVVTVGIILTLYPLAQARYAPPETAKWWTYGGFSQVLILWIYLWQITPPSVHHSVVTWGLAILAPGGAVLYQLPWAKWGWIPQPWQQFGLGVPLVFAVMTFTSANAGSWFIAALTYAALSYRTQQLRLSYWGLLFLDATVWRWCIEQEQAAFLWYTLPLALSLLWIAALDPRFQDPHRQDPRLREIRHNLRLLGTALICGVVLLPGQGSPWGILALSLLSVLAGLALRIRAFLYLGTATFLGYSLYQGMVLVTQQSLLKWGVGFAFGIILIWIAATFETRRDQIRTVLYGWAEALAAWE